MTTPNVPHRMELTFEMPGTPEQVWDAIATGNGISSWFMPTDLEERLGGAVSFHMGDTSSDGTVTGWDPPRRIEYEEPDWAGLTGREDAAVTPLVTEFLVEATSGGSCVVRVTSSAFGVGAEWEEEFFKEMEQGWVPYFDLLRMYLQHFPGQQVTFWEAGGERKGEPEALDAAMKRDLGVGAVGDAFAAHGYDGVIERVELGDVTSASISPNTVLVRTTQPVPGFLMLATYRAGGEEGMSRVQVANWMFGDNADAVREREQPKWQKWLDALEVSV
jgi:uncharacterized protein YndB with AHSA1/START domain